MRFDPIIVDYLKGERFTNGIPIKIATNREKFADRIEIIEKIVNGKKIIHVGCCDHLPLIQQKYRNDTWLHARLCHSAEVCIGIDINREGIEYLKKTFDYKNVYYLDISESEENFIHTDIWDYFVLADVLEHINNPCEFLRKINKNYSKCVKKLVISVPNALSALNFISAIVKREYVNTDHRFIFTPYTLAKIVTEAGMCVEKFRFCQPHPNYRETWFQKIIFYTFFIQRLFFRLFPTFQNTIVMVVRVQR